MNTTRTPVVFIHGLWLHASSWDPWVDLFTAEGYAPVAPGWPGVPETAELARAQPDPIADYGIEEVTTYYAGIIDRLPARPVIIGHSFGGMIAEKLLGEDLGAAAIAIDAAQIKGVLPLPLSALRCRSSRTPPMPAGPSPSPPSSSGTRSATRYRRRSRTRYTSNGPFPRPASRSSRRPAPTSPCTRRRRSTPATRSGVHCY
jgi:pimeloyl-ACP methyl ester carboxylesterase